jgi:hypothetical protein
VCIQFTLSASALQTKYPARFHNKPISCYCRARDNARSRVQLRAPSLREQPQVEKPRRPNAEDSEDAACVWLLASSSQYRTGN